MTNPLDHQSPRILVVDDQAGIRRTMTGIIENWGCQVVSVEDGYQAIESVRNIIFDLVFLDIKMPGINGIQTFREIKKLRPNILVVMMTGFKVQELIDAAFIEGAMCVVYKPFDPQRIINILRSVDRSCPLDLPINIGALTGKIQSEIDFVADDPHIARVAVRIPDSELRALRLVAVSGPGAEYTDTLVSSAGLDGMAYYANEVQVINDYHSHPFRSESEICRGVRSVLAVPMRSDSGRVLGSVAVSSYEPDYFNPLAVDRFRGLAQGVGNLMETTSPSEAEYLHILNRSSFPAAEALVGPSR